MNSIISSVYFGIIVSVAAYQAGVLINRRFKSPLTNPLFISTALVIILINALGISVADFQKGGSFLEMLILPATVCLALSIYNNYSIVKENIVPIITGTAAGSLSSVVSVLFLCHVFGLDEQIAVSMLPRSVTMPIALEISALHGGVSGLTTAAVMISGVFGAMISPYLAKLLKTSPVATGLSIGTCSHVAGTSRAVELGEIQGAVSGIAVGFSGLFTVIWSLFI